MNNFRFCSPTEFIFGKNTICKVAQLVKQYGGSKVLIHYGNKSAKKSGLLTQIENCFQNEFIEYVKLGGVQPNPIDELVYKGIELGRKEKVNFILAIGGGSVIDSAKAIAAGILYNGDFWNFFEGIVTINHALPIATVLTLPAAGSEGSPNTVITKTDGMLKRGIGSSFIRPVFSIMDPVLTFTLPTCQTVYGIADMMAHVMERYFTQTQGVDITDRMCESILLSIIHSAKTLIREPENYDARANIMWASTIAHNGICGVGREEDWATHALEHELSALYNIAHGAGLAVMFPAWMQYVYTAGIDRFVQFATRVWNIENIGSKKEIALKGIHALKDFFSSIKLPINFEQLGAQKSDIDKLIDTLKINTKGKLGNFLLLDMNDARAIYEIAAKR
ncbi:iron-containing alcohol dehydrogenase [Candidatus Azobacteroides pseudotrichonymphae]|uniref:Iron-containing alcohol dehydrogenase n=1 Tax=Azobacteroides pseudotrichonymphae genomovar. CFP2 TaxID=511995 RepID=B6YQP9_AZOPC|nr:iron-containing alcohol dehydrogenase [Candidatus Azobacteroides pseudotrichonymphae]BAG83521.1 iron-containing alcohol dehydrogenase [Candidatus Azobacteroides pseudotrichonymphae genomovar. CFP2]